MPILPSRCRRHHRRRGLGFLALAALSVSPMLILACEDSSPPPAGPTLTGPTATTPTTPTTTPTGTGTTPPTDGAPPAPKGVKVTVFAAEPGPAIGVRVLLHDANGLVITDTKTDAMGVVTATSAPSMITVIKPPSTADGFRPEYTTFTDIADGDEIVVNPNLGPPQAQLGTFSATLTGDPQALTNAQYAVSVGVCAGFGPGNGGPGVYTVDLYSQCTKYQTATAAVLAYRDSGEGIRYAFTNGLTVPAKGVTTNVAVGATWSDAAIATIKIAGAPDTEPSQSLALIASAVPFEISFSGGSATNPAGTTYPIPSGFAPEYQFTAEYVLVAGGRVGISQRKAIAAAGNLDINLAHADLPAEVATVTYAQSAIVGRPDTSWTLGAGGGTATPNAVQVIVSWNNAQQDTSHSWVVIGDPAKKTKVGLPDLPQDLKVTAPGATDNVSAQVRLYRSNTLDTWTKWKKLPYAPGFEDAAFRNLPAADTVTYSANNFNND